MHLPFRLLILTGCLFLLGCAAKRNLTTAGDDYVPMMTAFRYEADKTPLGQTYLYTKSNRDGSHASNIALHVAGPDRLESLKWWDGDQEATLVVAEMDWVTFSVRRFENWLVTADGQRQLRVSLTAPPASNKVVVEVGGKTDTTSITSFPWHTYDFDLASLSFTLPHLREPEAKFQVMITDPAMQDGRFTMENKGPVVVEFLQKEKDQTTGERVRKYRIDGPGLQNKGGHLWVSVKNPHIVAYQIAIPDEEEYDSGNLRLTETLTHSKEEWEAFIGAKLGK